MRISLICLLLFSFLTSNAQKERKKPVDLLIYNAKIYTVDERFSNVNAMVISDGKIVDLGSNSILSFKYLPSISINAQGKFIYPGFIDAHAHFYRYGLGLQTANLTGTSSWEEILSLLQSFAKKNPEGWLMGRGWDQNDWPDKEFPDRAKLDELFPDRPVILTRIDGHAAIVNRKAIELSGIRPGTSITGGSIEEKNGRLTGILIDNAADVVYQKIPEPTSTQAIRSVQEGQQNCFAVGLTTVDDCGLDYREVLFMDSLQKAGLLKMRVYAMLSDSKRNLDYLIKRGKIKTERMNVRSFKVYADGALGSRGACLLEAYADRPDWKGFLLSHPSHFDSLAGVLLKNDFQMCTHAIGDSGNRTILKIYGKHLKGKNDRRWRIEHAQVVHPDDFHSFGNYSIIPSVQPTHATSDMYWAEQRLGFQRVRGAYAYRQLLEQNRWLPLGTDFPVEDISPIKTFYAAVFRRDAKGYPQERFQKENALTREQAIRGMTIWAARSNFEEGEKGSLEKGKWADFVILDQDLMKASEAEVLKTQVIATYIAGERVYRK